MSEAVLGIRDSAVNKNVMPLLSRNIHSNEGDGKDSNKHISK